jgi:hypothetical protein
VADVDYEAQQPQPFLYSPSLYRWHDYFAILHPIESPAGLTVSPATSTVNNIGWTAVYGATQYTLRRTSLADGSTYEATVTGTSTSDTVPSATTQYAYQVKATNGSSTSTYSPAITVFRSQPLYDGYVTANTSNNNGSSAAGIRAGQSTVQLGQLKGIVSFNTGALPDICTILGATLREKQGTDNTNFDTLGTCSVDIKKGAFGDDPALAAGDFDPADKTDTVGALPEAGLNGWGELSLSAYLDDINKTGVGTIQTTQFRQYFGVYGGANVFVGWYPGDAGVTDQPQLVVRYQP